MVLAGACEAFQEQKKQSRLHQIQAGRACALLEPTKKHLCIPDDLFVRTNDDYFQGTANLELRFFLSFFWAEGRSLFTRLD